MPDWVPQVVPDLCPRCGAYWECECGTEWPLGGVEARLISRRLSDDGWGVEDLWEFPIPTVVEDLPDMEQVEHGPAFSKKAMSLPPIISATSPADLEKAKQVERFLHRTFAELERHNAGPQPDEVGCQILLTTGKHMGPCLGTCRAP